MKKAKDIVIWQCRKLMVYEDNELTLRDLQKDPREGCTILHQDGICFRVNKKCDAKKYKLIEVK